VDGREEGKIGAAECGEVPESRYPSQTRAENAFQIGFCGKFRGPEAEGLQNVFQVNRDAGLGEFGNRHGALDSYIGKMFKKERRK
jgi:hypothetical protein